MKNIVTVTFNPAIDVSTTVTELVPQRKMKCTSPIYQPGGGGINVARVITRLGGRAIAIYLAGGYTGDYFNKLLEQENVLCIPTSISASTRENMVVLDIKTNQQYRFGMPGPEIGISEIQKCLFSVNSIADIDMLVASGSLPQGAPSDTFVELGKIAASKKALFIVDTSGEPLVNAVAGGVYLIKPNLRELCTLSGKELSSDDEIIGAAQALVSSGRCQVVVVSLGDQGAILITKNENRKIIPPKVKVKSTVGAGDSMVAGIVTSLANGAGILEAFRYGVASGTAATLNAGTELCHFADVENLYRELPD